MENDNKIIEEQPKQVPFKVSTPMAIIVAGFLIMIGVLLTNGSIGVKKEKTLSEQVGVSKEKLMLCLEETNLEELYTKSGIEADSVMKNIPADQRGTPYIVLVGKDGAKVEIRGYVPYDDYNVKGITEKLPGLKKITDNMLAGKATSDYTGELPLPNENDHIMGSLDAKIIIVEYSDLECPFCKKFGEAAKRVVEESNGQIAWVYRHWVVHVQQGQNALPKAAATECIAKIKGNDAFWKYVDLLFGLIKTADDTKITDQL